MNRTLDNGRLELALVENRITGHREEYVRVLGKELQLLGIATTSIISRNRFSFTKATLFFPTLDDSTAEFVGTALARALCGRATVGLFLRPSTALSSKNFGQRSKYAAFRMLRMLRRVQIITIIPFDIAPGLSKIAHSWMYDPQFWDLTSGEGAVAESPELSAIVDGKARGRSLVVALGAQHMHKGFDFFSDIWLTSEAIREKYLFVVAGQLKSELVRKARAFEEAGGVCINRRIEPQELHFLYRRCDVVWACYAPEYNVSSGIFGRALQYGRPVILRSGSYIGEMVVVLKHPGLQLPYYDTQTAITRLLSWRPHPVKPELALKKASEWKRASLKTLSASIMSASW